MWPDVASIRIRDAASLKGATGNRDRPGGNWVALGGGAIFRV